MGLERNSAWWAAPLKPLIRANEVKRQALIKGNHYTRTTFSFNLIELKVWLEDFNASTRQTVPVSPPTIIWPINTPQTFISTKYMRKNPYGDRQMIFLVGRADVTPSTLVCVLYWLLSPSIPNFIWKIINQKGQNVTLTLVETATNFILDTIS